VDLPFPLDAFADRVAFCTAFKLRGPGYREEDAAAFQGEQAGVFWREALTYARRLWRWELRRLTGLPEGLSDRDLMRAWMRRQPLHRRLRGWARVIRDSGWRRSWRAWPRWLMLALQASPRHWVYAAATEIVFRLPDAGNLDAFNAAPICERLPLPPAPQALDTVPRWAKAGLAVLSNYERFVAVTRA
jgi:hypothetical protein